MSASPPPVPLETLLTHRAWVRRLARSLVVDGPSADDVEQQTWLAALRNPPRHQATARAWLGRVVRNLALDSRRARLRRDAHELLAARPEAVRSTEHVIAEAEAHTHLVTAVNSLAEPYRTTVLLRWFEDLPPTTIADRMDVPVETVRTRLRRAHHALRDDLGSMAGGESGWIAALTPLTGLRPETAAGSMSAAAKAAVTLVGEVMVTKSAVAVAVAGAFVGGRIVGTAGGTTPEENEVAALRARLDALESNVASSTRRGSSDGNPRSSGAEDRVSAQESRIAEVEAALALVRADVGRIAGKEAGARAGEGAAVPDVDVAAELERLGALSTEDLLAEIRTLNSVGASGKKIDGKAIVRACEVFLARNAEAATRYEVLIIKGIGHRSQISRQAQDQRPYAEAAFRDAQLLAGSGTDEARSAERHLAWTAQKAGDQRAAAEAYVRLAADTRDTASSRAANRLSAAEAFDFAQDAARATSELQSLIDEFGTSEEARGTVERARTKLDEISRRAFRR